MAKRGPNPCVNYNILANLQCVPGVSRITLQGCLGQIHHLSDILMKEISSCIEGFDPSRFGRDIKQNSFGHFT